MTAVPIFHRAGVYTAYEYLEKRFDAKTRALASIIFLIQRGLAVGVALYAPAIVLTVIFGWPDQWTTIIMGVLVVIYTVSGGIQGRDLDGCPADADHVRRRWSPRSSWRSVCCPRMSPSATPCIWQARQDGSMPSS